jgi:23S rRNA (adenine2503-C2)-methyltransferase
MTQPSFYDLSPDGLQAFLQEIGEPPYRAKQIHGNIWSRLIDDPARMTDLPAGLRAELARRFDFRPLRVDRETASADGQTRKFLFRLPDDAPVETVWMRYDRRQTVCISTQSGCGMNCSFCATGRMGLRRSLTAGEIAAQALYVAGLLRAEGRGLTNLVLMGMGEPFVNYEATLAATGLLADPAGFGFGARRMTVSTVGIVPGIRRFAAERSQINLAVSLHAADDDLRDRLVPINRTYPLDEVFAACDEYIQRTNRRLSFEWALIEGVNDTAAQAHRLADRIRRQLRKPLAHVNLIPLNPTRGYSGAPSSAANVAAFQSVLDDAGVACTVRLSRGAEIGAGCGQLAGAADG